MGAVVAPDRRLGDGAVAMAEVRVEVGSGCTTVVESAAVDMGTATAAPLAPLLLLPPPTRLATTPVTATLDGIPSDTIPTRASVTREGVVLPFREGVRLGLVPRGGRHTIPLLRSPRVARATPRLETAIVLSDVPSRLVLVAAPLLSEAAGYPCRGVLVVARLVLLDATPRMPSSPTTLSAPLVECETRGALVRATHIHSSRSSSQRRRCRGSSDADWGTRSSEGGAYSSP